MGLDYWRQYSRNHDWRLIPNSQERLTNKRGDVMLDLDKSIFMFLSGVATTMFIGGFVIHSINTTGIGLMIWFALLMWIQNK